MLYRILRILFIPTYRAYFRSLIVNKKRNLPLKGPLIVAVNHTSAFMDPILVAVSFERIFHFLARGEAFNSNFSRYIYAKINMLPLYRPETMPDDVHKNKFIFQKCYDHLKNEKAIMMFPEGFSKTERKLRPIKSGLARMALGAEADNDFTLGTKVVAIGLNYSNPHIFRSDVFINVSEAIEVKDFREIYQDNRKKAIDSLTEKVKEAMEATTVVIGDERTDVFIHNVEKLLQYHLEKKDLGLRKFEMTKELVQKLEKLPVENREQFEKIEMRLSNYVDRLKRLKLKGNRIFAGKIKSSFILNVLMLVLGFPVFALGTILNIIPFILTAYVSRRIQVRDDFVGSLKSVAGMFLFLIFYLAISFTMACFTSWYWGMLLFISLYPLGILAMQYINTYLDLIEDYRHTRIFRRKKTFMDNLRNERKAILSELDIPG